MFPDVPIDASDKFVDLDEFAQRGHGEFVPQRELKLVDLTSEGLHRLRVPKEELIASPSRVYPETGMWAQALHRQFTEVDGLSRQRDRDHALVLFGDRMDGVLRGRRISGPGRVPSAAQIAA